MEYLNRKQNSRFGYSNMIISKAKGLVGIYILYDITIFPKKTVWLVKLSNTSA